MSMFLQVVHRRVPDLQLVASELHEITVVQDDDFSICRFLHIKFDPVGSVGDRLAKGCHRVFRGCRRRSAMRHDGDIVLKTDTLKRDRTDGHGDHNANDPRGNQANERDSETGPIDRIDRRAHPCLGESVATKLLVKLK